jgi:hypothetical protein
MTRARCRTRLDHGSVVTVGDRLMSPGGEKTLAPRWLSCWSVQPLRDPSGQPPDRRRDLRQGPGTADWYTHSAMRGAPRTAGTSAVRGGTRHSTSSRSPIRWSPTSAVTHCGRPPAHRRHRGREPGPAAFPAGSRVLSELHRQLRLEARRLRAPGQPGHLALRRQRLQRPPGVPQGHRRLAPLPRSHDPLGRDVRAAARGRGGGRFASRSPWPSCSPGCAGSWKTIRLAPPPAHRTWHGISLPAVSKRLSFGKINSFIPNGGRSFRLTASQGERAGAADHRALA